MAEGLGPQPIIIKRVRGGDQGHHGGAWKIAYADFVTAMMAFFLLLWLLNSVTQEQLEGISNFFSPVSASDSMSGSGGILGGKVIAEEGVGTSQSAQASVTMDLPPPRAGTGGQESTLTPSDEAAEERMREIEEEQFREAEAELKQAIESLPNLEQLKDSLLVDNTPEGMRIQLVDREGLAMFPRGGANMHLHTRRLLELVSKVVLTMPQKLSISGHTDATQFVTDTGYSNWELSADRANAARRALVELKVPITRMSRVVGKAATEPLITEDPSDARNRRLSIMLLRGTGETKPPKPPEEALPGLEKIRAQQRQDGVEGTRSQDGADDGAAPPRGASSAPTGAVIQLPAKPL